MGLFKSIYCTILFFADLQIELDLFPVSFPVSFTDAYLKSSSGVGSRVTLRSHYNLSHLVPSSPADWPHHARQG